MLTRTMHMGGYAADAARLGEPCAAHLAPAANLPSIVTKPWHATTRIQVSPVFGTDRPIRRPLERWP